MFADYNGHTAYDGYGDFGRSWRKTLRKITKAPIKLVTKVTKPITKTALGLTKSVISKATGANKQVARTVEEQIEQPTIESTIAPQIDQYMQPQIQSSMPAVAPSQPTMQQIQEMIRASMASTQTQQSYVPRPVYQATKAEQQYSEPQESYYQQSEAPVDEGRAQSDEFAQQEFEEYDYPVEDFGGYGLDDETTALLVKEYKQDTNAAIEAGKDYISKIQGRTKQDGKVVTEKPNTDNPSKWLLAALGLVALTAVVAYKPKRKR
jgi:hypothetical protein